MEEKIIDFIKTQVEENPANLRGLDRGKYFGSPLVGFSRGDDPLYQQYKEIIGPFHQTPLEILQNNLPEDLSSLKAEEVSVISWILPISEDIRKSNRKKRKFPSKLWAHTRYFGEEFNMELRREVVAFLRNKGYQAVAPMLADSYKAVDDPRIGRASNWSERHAAFGAGLGSFGLSDGFISKKGVAHRCGSVVTTLPLRPSPRNSSFPYHNCLYYLKEKCGVCIRKCPAGAITEKGHDKGKCRQYVYGTVLGRFGKAFGVKATGCGLCQVGVPCEAEIPKP